MDLEVNVKKNGTDIEPVNVYLNIDDVIRFLGTYLAEFAKNRGHKVEDFLRKFLNGGNKNIKEELQCLLNSFLVYFLSGEKPGLAEFVFVTHDPYTSNSNNLEKILLKQTLSNKEFAANFLYTNEKEREEFKRRLDNNTLKKIVEFIFEKEEFTIEELCNLGIDRNLIEFFVNELCKKGLVEKNEDKLRIVTRKLSGFAPSTKGSDFTLGDLFDPRVLDISGNGNKGNSKPRTYIMIAKSLFKEALKSAEEEEIVRALRAGYTLVCKMMELGKDAFEFSNGRNTFTVKVTLKDVKPLNIKYDDLNNISTKLLDSLKYLFTEILRSNRRYSIEEVSTLMEAYMLLMLHPKLRKEIEDRISSGKSVIDFIHSLIKEGKLSEVVDVISVHSNPWENIIENPDSKDNILRLKRLEFILQSFDLKIDRHIRELSEKKIYRRLPRRIPEEAKLLIRKMVYYFKVSNWDEIKEKIKIPDEEFQDNEGAKWVVYLLLNEEEFEKLVNGEEIEIEENLKDFLKNRMGKDDGSKYSERYIKSLLNKIREGKIKVGYIYSFVGRKIINRLRRLNFVEKEERVGYATKYNTFGLKMFLDDVIEDSLLEERKSKEGRVRKFIKIIFGVPYALIAGTVSNIATIVRNIYEVVVGKEILETFQYPRRLWEMFRIFESLGKEIKDEEGNSPNTLIYTLGKTFGNFVDSVVGAILFGPAGTVMGGLSIANAVLADAGNLAKVVLDLYKRIGKKIGVKSYPLKAEKILDKYMQIVAWSYQVIDKTFALLHKPTREWIKSIYKELSGNNMQTFKNLVIWTYERLLSNEIKINNNIRETLDELLKSRGEIREAPSFEEIKEELKNLGYNIDNEKLKYAYAISVLKMYSDISDKLSDIIGETEEEKFENLKKALAIMTAIPATPFYLIYKWAKGDYESFVEKINELKRLGIKGIFEEAKYRYKYAYEKISEYVDKFFDKLGEYISKISPSKKRMEEFVVAEQISAIPEVGSYLLSKIPA